jgi:hypothetical protein
MPARESIVKDFWLKLFSLALAILIWATVKFVLHNQANPVTQAQPGTDLPATNKPAPP